jgi:hypothetical protein
MCYLRNLHLQEYAVERLPIYIIVMQGKFTEIHQHADFTKINHCTIWDKLRLHIASQFATITSS